MEKALYSVLNKSWKSAAKILFGQELGELSDYEEWLSEFQPKTARRNSHASGKEVIVSRDVYPKEARFISAEECTLNKGYALSINDVKDIDSVVEALREKCEYTGNRFLGNSSFVESSDIVIDSQYIHNSTNVEQSQYADSCFMLRRGSKYAFASGWGGSGEFIVRTIGFLDIMRVFESYLIGDCSDVYFSYDCVGCHDVMFSFGQRNKRNVIGNLALPKERYLQVKRKLLSEVAEELRRDKRFPSLFGLFSDAPKSLPRIKLEKKREEAKMDVLEKGFSSTFGILLKKQPGSMLDYEKWLSQNIGGLEEVSTPFGSKTYVPSEIRAMKSMPRGRVVNAQESRALSEFSVDGSSMSGLSSLVDALDGIAFFTPEMLEGETQNIVKSPLVYHATNIYGVYDSSYSDHSGISFLTLHSKYAYGCYRIMESQFSMKCYNSLHLNRCLELDGCTKCSDTYFSHNCEAMSDSMFCFNMKGARNSIGNTEFPKEKYLALKGSLIEQLANELQKNKSLKWNIYNIGGKR